MSEKDAQYWIEKLGLKPHPEGGYYLQTYRPELTIGAAAACGGLGVSGTVGVSQ